jgi:hypothetical protein
VMVVEVVNGMVVVGRVIVLDEVTESGAVYVCVEYCNCDNENKSYLHPSSYINIQPPDPNLPRILQLAASTVNPRAAPPKPPGCNFRLTKKQGTNPSL